MGAADQGKSSEGHTQMSDDTHLGLLSYLTVLAIYKIMYHDTYLTIDPHFLNCLLVQLINVYILLFLLMFKACIVV